MRQNLTPEFRSLLDADGPEPIIDWLRHQKEVPELYALYGVEERKDYHPEGDSGVHLEMAIGKAWEFCSAPEERAAVVLHDIGKAVTGRALANPTGIQLTEYRFDAEGKKIANHIGHDRIGADMMPSTFARLGLPVAWLPLATTVALYHQRLHQVEHMDANGIARLVSDIAAAMPSYSRSAAVEAMVRCVRADFNGRLGFEDLNYRQGDVLRACERAMTAWEGAADEREAAVLSRSRSLQALFDGLRAENRDIADQFVWNMAATAMRAGEAAGTVVQKPKTLHAFLQDQLRECLAAPAGERVMQILKASPKSAPAAERLS